LWHDGMQSALHMAKRPMRQQCVVLCYILVREWQPHSTPISAKHASESMEQGMSKRSAKASMYAPQVSEQLHIKHQARICLLVKSVPQR